VAADEMSEPAPMPESSPGFRLSAEYDLEETYIGEATVRRGRHVVSDLDEYNTLVRFVLTPRVGIGVLRLGASYERFAFGSNGSWADCDTLQAANVVIGLDTRFSDSILVRAESQLGFYGAGMDDLEGDDID